MSLEITILRLQPHSYTAVSRKYRLIEIYSGIDDSGEIYFRKLMSFPSWHNGGGRTHIR